MGVDIIIVEKPNPSHDNLFNENAVALYKKIGSPPLRCTSLKDMVDKVLESAGDDCIRSLLIVGHGSPGEISTGDGKTRIAGKNFGRNPGWEDELRRLNGKFCRDNGFVMLNGCKVGALAEGAQFLQKVADILGTSVQAPTGTKSYRIQWGAWPFFYSYDYVYEEGTQIQGAVPGQPAPSPMPLPSPG